MMLIRFAALVASMPLMLKFLDTTYYKSSFKLLFKRSYTDYPLLNELHKRKVTIGGYDIESLGDYIKTEFKHPSDIEYVVYKSPKDYKDFFKTRNFINFLNIVKKVNFDKLVDDNLSQLKQIPIHSQDTENLSRLLKLLTDYHSNLLSIFYNVFNVSKLNEERIITAIFLENTLKKHSDSLEKSQNLLQEICKLYSHFVLENNISGNKSIQAFIDSIEFLSFSNILYLFLKTYITDNLCLSNESSIWHQISISAAETYTESHDSIIGNEISILKTKKDKFAIKYISHLFNHLITQSYFLYVRKNHLRKKDKKALKSILVKKYDK